MSNNGISTNKVTTKTAFLKELRKLLNNDKKYETFISCFITERDDKNNSFNFGDRIHELDIDGDGFFSDEELEALRKATDENLALSDIKTFFQKFIEAPTRDDVLEEGFKEFSNKYPDIPKNVLEMFYNDFEFDIETFNFYELDGQYILEINELDSDSKYIQMYNENWELIANTAGDIKINGLEGQELCYYDEKGQSATRIMFRTGVIQHMDHRKKENYRQIGNSFMTYKFNAEFKEVPQELSLGGIKFDIVCDENGKVSEIKNKFDEETKKQFIDFNRVYFDNLMLDDNEKNRIIDLLNSGKKFGIDFTIDNEYGKVAVKPILINKTDNSLVSVPQNVTEDYFKLLDNKIRAGIDFDLEYSDKGFKFEMRSQTGSEGADFKRVEYSPNGQRKITTIYEENEVVTTIEQNGNLKVSRQSRAELLLEALLKSDFEHVDKILGLRGVGLGDEFNYNEVYKKYSAITGKNAMEEAIKYADNNKTAFDPAKLIFGGSIRIIEDNFENPQKYRKDLIEQFNKDVEQGQIIKNYNILDPKIKACIYKQNKTILNENSFIERINGENYAVKAENNCIKVRQGNQTYSINLEKNPSIVKNILMKQNALVLKHLAQKGTSFDWYDQETCFGDPSVGSVNIAFYSSENNRIALRGDLVDDNTITREIAHETGHVFHNESEHVINKNLKTVMKEELAVWKESGEQYDDKSYCVTSYNEMVAECYSLIVTGKSDSAYTIENYFPRTLAIVRQMIDNKNLH